MCTAILSSCKDRSPAPAEPSPAEAPTSTASKYPLLYEKYIDTGQELEGHQSFWLDPNPKLLKALENQLVQHIESSEPEDGFTYGILRNADESLVIKFSPKTTEGTRTMIAIWKALEGKVTVTRHSEPLEGKEEALALLKSYSSLAPNIEPSAKWTVKSRGMDVTFD